MSHQVDSHTNQLRLSGARALSTRSNHDNVLILGSIFLHCFATAWQIYLSNYFIRPDISSTKTRGNETYNRFVIMISQIETGFSQQPISLITINSNLNKRNQPNDENLLTIRILEASERKMQLIKQLLSPEEFDSIAPELRTDFKYLDDYKTTKSAEQSTGYSQIQIQDTHFNNGQVLDKRLSKSESNILSNFDYNLHDNILQKREALEFFFSEPYDKPVKIVRESRDLTIELRSGYYLNTSLSFENDENIIKNFGFTLRDRFYGLLNYFNLSFEMLNTKKDEDVQEIQQSEFIDFNRKLNHKPYTSKRNMVRMNRRLQVENELDKVVSDQKGFEIRTKRNKNRQMKELILDRDYKVIVDMNRISHFRPIQNVCSKQFKSTELFDILKYPKILGYLPIIKPNQVNLASPALMASSRLVNIKLSAVKLTRHKLLSPEENIAVKLVDCQFKVEQVQNSLDIITCKLIRIIDEQISRNATEITGIAGKHLKAMLEWRYKVVNCLKVLQKQLREMYNEMEFLRREQNFKSTGILLCYHDIGSDKKEKLKSFKDSLSRLIKLVEGKEKGIGDSFKKFLEQEDCNVAIRANEFGLQITDIDSCPKEEYQRRLNLKRWLESLRIRFYFGPRFFYECTIRSRRSNYLIALDLSESAFHIPIQADQSDLIMKFEVLQRRHNLVPFYRDLIATNKDKLELSEIESRGKTILKFIDKQSEIEVDFTWSVEELENNRTRFSRETRQLVDAIYRKTFVTNHAFDNINTKLFRLFNQVDLRYLILYLLDGTNESDLSSNLFTLNPFLDKFKDHEHDCKGSSEGSMRQVLLVWRWLNNINQTVYLSDRENNKHHDLNRLEEIDSKLRLISATKLESGYKAIEQMRIWAVDCIKKYESHLNEVIQFNNNILNHQQSTTHLRDLLLEPRIKIDLSGLVNLKHGIIPKRSARRPLLPKRSKKGNVGKNFQQDIIQHSKEESKTIDLESQVFDHWQRFTSRMRLTHKLQLVVTIQQANNLPMRVIQQQTIMTRSNTPQPYSSTPVGPTGPSTSPSNFFNLVPSELSSNANIGTQASLSPPTTYVEVVFQRKQQASSLAHGKNPIWHETLFFPVDVPKFNYLASQSGLNFHVDGEDNQNSNNTIEGGNVKAQSQLVDEFLQLNLYDYNCHVHTDTMNSDRQNELATLPLTSTSLSISDNTLQSNRMLASRQRIERHLLGSLRVPLKTLLSTGRIEGSFALNQPLFMENYQFEPEQQVNMSGILSTQKQQNSNFKINNKFETYISLFITLDPPILIPFYLYLSTGSHEDEQIFEFAKLWERTVSRYKRRISKRAIANNLQTSSESKSASYYHIRHVRAVVLQHDAKYCFVSRLITPLKPPEELVEGTNKSKLFQMRSLARFVSLLSPLKYGIFNMRLLASNLWFDSAQLINKYLGGTEEKAVLLCNYYLHLGHCSAVLLGDAIPEGRCAYVIVWHEQSRKLDEQLQLNIASLLESSGGVASSDNQSRDRLVDQENFLLSLPILINSKTVQLWDPNSGKSYNLNDPLQLISVGSIVTCENVYANIQATESVQGTNFDIRLRNFWFPLFEGSTKVDSKIGNNFRRTYLKRTNQTNNIKRQLIELEETRRLIGRVLIKPILKNEIVQLNYEKLTEEHCRQLENSIDRAIKAQLLKWRPSRPTYFNRTLSRLLAEKLKLFEDYSIEASLDSSTEQPIDWKSELADLIRNEILMPHLSNGFNARQVVSWPMNLPYTSMKTILDSLYASGVHNADIMLESAGWNLNSASSSSTQLSQSTNCNTQFLVACHAYAYPARVVSVWLYVAAVITQNRLLLT